MPFYFTKKELCNWCFPVSFWKIFKRDLDGIFENRYDLESIARAGPPEPPEKFYCTTFQPIPLKKLVTFQTLILSHDYINSVFAISYSGIYNINKLLFITVIL